MIKFFNLGGIILLLAWISFIPQDIQTRYLVLVRFFLVILFILSIIRKGGLKKIILNRIDITLWIFIISLLAAVFFAEDLNMAIRRYLSLFVPLFFLYYLIKTEFYSENRWPIIRTICFLSSIVALFGILEWIFRRNPIYEYFDIFDLYYHVFLGRRAMSTQGHPAVLGSYLVACLPFSFLLIERKAIFEKSLGILCLTLCIICMILTFSRGSVLGLIALFCVYFYAKNKLLFFRYFLIILTIFILVFSVSKKESVFNRFGIGGFTDKNLYKYRALRVATSYRMFKDHPFSGVGLDHFRIKHNEYSSIQHDTEDAKVPDNMYLLFLAEAGIIGFLGFSIFIVNLLKEGFRRFYSLSSVENKNILIAIIAALVGLLVNMNTYDLLYWATPLYLFSILSGMLGSYCDA